MKAEKAASNKRVSEAVEALKRVQSGSAKKMLSDMEWNLSELGLKRDYALDTAKNAARKYGKNSTQYKEANDNYKKADDVYNQALTAY